MVSQWLLAEEDSVFVNSVDPQKVQHAPVDGPTPVRIWGSQIGVNMLLKILRDIKSGGG